MSLIVSAFAPVSDVRRALTPQLRLDRGPTRLLLVDLGRGQNRLGASCLLQAYGALGDVAPDVDAAADVRALFEVVSALSARGSVLAYHDRSDGGLFVTLLEMAFAGGAGLEIELPEALGEDPIAALFAEELGAVLQVSDEHAAAVSAAFAARGLVVHDLGRPVPGTRIELRRAGATLYAAERSALRAAWSETTHAIQRLRDDESCADEEQQARLDAEDPGLSPKLTFDPAEDIAAPYVQRGARPRVAILREQGVNGQLEMGAAFDRAGFEAVDVHMTDLLSGSVELSSFVGLAACGGFSYGDVLGAGEGWAKSILFHARVRDAFAAFFARPETFALGVCNGCQMMSNLHELVPGAEQWPRFVQNRSERYESRLVQLRVEASPSVLFRGMQGSVIPIVVAHGEGRVELRGDDEQRALDALDGSGLVTARYVDHRGQVSERYPRNPSGSPRGICAVTTRDGRVTILMPHPERVFRSVALSWRPDGWGEDSPTMRIFRNARAFVG
jgi:phosphoribosylformylglycinamidine synthase